MARLGRTTGKVLIRKKGIPVISPVGTPFQVAYGSYTGNGSSSHAIIGLAFQPDVVLVKSANAVSGDVWFRTADMPATYALPLRADAGKATGYINSLDATGFTVGSQSDANNSGDTFYYAAFKSNGGGDFAIFTYTGDGTDNLAITSLGFQPDFVTSKSDSGVTGASRFSTAPDSSLSFDGGNRLDNFKSLDSSGFTLGNGSTSGGNLVNISGVAHYGFAFRQVAVSAKVFSYTGDGTSSHVISGLGLTPGFTWIKGNDGNFANIKFNAELAANSLPLVGAEISTGVTAFSSGSITLSSSGTVNANGDSYYGLAVTAPSGSAFTQGNTDSITLSDAIRFTVVKGIADTVTASDSRLTADTHTIADTITLANASSAAVGKILSDSITTADSIRFAVVHTIADTVTLSDSVNSSLNSARFQSNSDTVTPSDAQAKALTKVLTDSVTPSDARTDKPVKTIAETVTPTDASTRAITKVLSDSVTPSDIRTGGINRLWTINDTQSTSNAFSALVGKSIPHTVTTGDAKTFSMVKGTAEAITIADLVSKVVLKSLSDSSTPTDAVTYFLGTRSGPPPSSRITLSHRQRRTRPRIRY